MRTVAMFGVVAMLHTIGGMAVAETHVDPMIVGTVAGLTVMPSGIETRWASAENFKGEKGQAAQANGGRKGSACFPFKAGEKRVIAEAVGASGTIRRIWVTIDDRSPQMLRGIKFDIYWDGASKPAVSAPLADFFGQGLGRMATFQSALFASPEGRSFNCYIPMPFRKGMRVEVTNESGKDLAMFFYDVDYTIGDKHPKNTLYFHAHYRRESPTTLQRDFELLPKIEGAGRFLGVNVGVVVNHEVYHTSWWGEGEVKMFIDGDTDFPTLSGTGTEDYIGTGWGQGAYANLYQGCTVADSEKWQYCFYRLHVPDPVYFHKDIRVTMQQIGCWGPDNRKAMHALGHPVYAAGPGLVPIDMGSDQCPEYGLFERRDDWSCCAYFYLDKPENGLPPIDPVEKRVAGLK